MKRRLPLPSLGLLLLTSSLFTDACRGGAQCLRNTDCATSERCELGACVMEPAPGSETGDAGAGGVGAAAGGKRGSGGEWHVSLPLLRVQNERTYYVETLNYTAPNMFAGSVFDLDEDTEYEVRFTLTDPDDVAGEAQRVVTVRTRAEPQPFAGGNTYHVYPFGYTGPKQEPAFTGLLAAYYKNALGGDWSKLTAVQLYTVHDIFPFLESELAKRGVFRNGLTWHFNRPPVQDLEYEMDCRRVFSERIVEV